MSQISITSLFPRCFLDILIALKKKSYFFFFASEKPLIMWAMCQS